MCVQWELKHNHTRSITHIDAPAFSPHTTPQIRINFNITMLDLPCKFAVVDVLDVLGTNRMNVSKNIEKVRGC